MYKIYLNFGGGLQNHVINSEKKSNIIISLPTSDCASLISYVAQNLLTEDQIICDKEHLQLKPGILVLINDCDWEIYGGHRAQLYDGDRVDFISTLHGG